MSTHVPGFQSSFRVFCIILYRPKQKFWSGSILLLKIMIQYFIYSDKKTTEGITNVISLSYYIQCYIYEQDEILMLRIRNKISDIDVLQC